jgi:hypothetical protein
MVAGMEPNKNGLSFFGGFGGWKTKKGMLHPAGDLVEYRLQE